MLNLGFIRVTGNSGRCINKVVDCVGIVFFAIVVWGSRGVKRRVLYVVLVRQARGPTIKKRRSMDRTSYLRNIHALFFRGPNTVFRLFCGSVSHF